MRSVGDYDASQSKYIHNFNQLFQNPAFLEYLSGKLVDLIMAA